MQTLRARIRRSPLEARARMVAPLARLRAHDDPGATPLIAALRTTILGRLDAADRAWIDRIEARRAELMSRGGSTPMPRFNGDAQADPGGGFAMSGPETSLGSAAAFMSLSPTWCVLLLRLMRELKPQSSLELCTGFGISGSYQAAGLNLNGSGRLITLEGSADWAASAVEGFAALGLDQQIESCVGPVAETLRTQAERAAPLDFVFVDAEHQEQATVDHFNTVLPYLAPSAIVAFDDVDWPGVRAAHQTIGEHEAVTTSILVGRLGFTIVNGRSNAR
jgi:predicted O-methyltransferase YrrM